MNAATDSSAVSLAVRSALALATAEGERVVAHRVVRHSAGHLVVWLDLEVGKMARLAVWDGSQQVSPLTISAKTRTRRTLRALRVHTTGAEVQNWTALAA